MTPSSSRPPAPERKPAPWLPLLYLLGGGALLGISTNLAKLAGELGLSPLAFLCWSCMGSAFLLLALAAWRGALPPVNARTLEYCAVSALVGVVLSNLIFFSAVPHVGAGFVALIISLPPLLTYVGALALRMERFQALRAFGVVAALAGAGVLAARKLSAPNADAFWILLALVGPVLLAIGNLYRTLRWPQGVSADALAPGTLVAASLMLLVAGAMPDAAEALRIGLVDELTGIDEVAIRARAWLEELLQLPRTPMLETRRIARADAVACLREERIDLPRFVGGWMQPDTQAALRAMLARIGK